MKYTLEVEVDERDIINQGDYADWYLSRSGTGIERISNAENGICRVRGRNGLGWFNLVSHCVSWDSGDDEVDMQDITDRAGYIEGPGEDFDCSMFLWGLDCSGDVPVNVLFATY